MKAIKDKVVMDDAYYFVLAYIDTSWGFGLEPLKKRGLLKYHQITGQPMFHMADLEYKDFVDILHEGLEWMLSKSQDLTLENIDKYNLK